MDPCCTNSNKHRWKMKDIIEEISSRLLNQIFIGLSVRIHIILYQLEYLFPKPHANLSGMASCQQTISSENHSLLTMCTKMWMVSWNYTSESTSSNILHQSRGRMVCQVIPWLEVLLPIPCCSWSLKTAP